MTAFCAKCRGDGLYNDYDSEVEEEELRRIDENCNECLHREESHQRRQDYVRRTLGLTFKDNNKLPEQPEDKGNEEAAGEMFKKEKRYPDSSDEDD